jgi:F0F1-type ATP synthase alpha subunit
MTLNLEKTMLALVFFGDDTGIKEGDTVKRTGDMLTYQWKLL